MDKSVISCSQMREILPNDNGTPTDRTAQPR